MSNVPFPPASVIASWPAPNYVDPVRRGPGLLITNIVLSSMAFILTALRVYTRGFITATIGVDDVLAVLALVMAIGMCTTTSIADARYGWDRHQWDVPLTWLPGSFKCRMIFEITFCVASNLTKISLLWFCRRLLGSSIKSGFRRLNYSLIGAMLLLAALGTIFIFTTLFNCIPVKASFDLKPDYPYRCSNGNAMLMAASVINVFTDFLTTIVPMPLIWKLQLPRRQRLAVIGIFGMGITVTICSSFRTYYAWLDSYGSWDGSWWGWGASLAASVEINLGLICASAPALRPLIKTMWPRLVTTRKMSEYASQHNHSSGPWTSSNGSHHRHIRMGSNESMRKKFGISERQDSAIESGIVRTVELETFYEDRNDIIYGRPVIANSNSGRGQPVIEATNGYGGANSITEPERSHSMCRGQDSFQESRDLEELDDEDEAPFALERMI